MRAQPRKNGERQAEREPDDEGPADEADDRVGEQVGGVVLGARAVDAAEGPADVGMDQPADRAAPAGSVTDVRAVRVALLVGEAVVHPVGGDPLDHRPLDRGRAEDREDGADRLAGLEAPVGEQAVVADRDAEAGEEVGDPHHDEVLPVEDPAPGETAGDEEQQERDDRDRAVRDPLDRLVLHHLDAVGVWNGRLVALAEPRLAAWPSRCGGRVVAELGGHKG